VVAAGGPVPSNGERPALAWTSSEYAIVHDTNMTAGGQVDLWGWYYTAVGTWRGASNAMLISDASIDVTPVAAWGTSSLAVAWSKRYTATDSLGIAFEIFDGDYASTGMVQLGDDHAEEPSIVWNGSRFAVCWDRISTSVPTDAIECQLIEESGTAASSVLTIVSDGNATRDPEVAWSGSEYAVAFLYEQAGEDDIAMQIFAADGNPTGSTVQITDSANLDFMPAMVWAGSHWAVLWTTTVDYSSADNHIQMVATDGSLIGSAIPYTEVVDTSFDAHAVWTGSAIAVAWSDGRVSVGNGEIFFKLLGADGSSLSSFDIC
jgi:hypothetical protein